MIVAGAVSVTLAVLATALFGSSPGIEASPSEVTHYADLHGVAASYAGWIEIAGFLAGLAFVIGLRPMLRAGHRSADGLMTVGIAALIVAIGAATTWGACVQATAFSVHTVAPETTRLLFQLSWFAITASALPTAVASIAIGLALLRSPALPNATGWLSLAAGGAHGLWSVSVMRHGTLSPTGPTEAVATVLYYLWIVSVLVALRRGGERSGGSNG